jgi:hypothetical protein
VARPPKAAIQKEFAYWMATPKRLKVSLGLPVSERQFAEMKDIDVRSLRRWKAREDFKALVESFKLEMANASPDSTIRAIGMPVPKLRAEDLPKVQLSDDPVLDDRLSPDEQKYLQVKDTLVQMAMDGNQGAMDLYLKHYGKAYVEAEQREFSDYRDMSDEDLVTELCAMVGVETISSWLSLQAAAEA